MRGLLTALLLAGVAGADAPVVTRAMTASTIAEVFVVRPLDGAWRIMELELLGEQRL